MATKRKSNEMAGPPSKAACPIVVKTPDPMIAAIPKAVRSRTRNARFNEGPLSRPSCLSRKMCSTDFLRQSSFSMHLQAEHAQVFAIPGSWNGFARSVRAGLIRARGDSLLAQFADMPILFVGHVPEFDGIVGMEVGPPKGLGMKEPVAIDEGAAGRLRPDLMHHDIIRVHAQKHVRK